MISIVTDSSAGYSRQELEKIGVKLIGLSYYVDGVPYEEKCRGENGAFMTVMAGHDVKTSQPSMGAFLDVLGRLTAEGDEVLVITLSGGLSGTFALAQAAAKQVEGTVRVVDSGSINAGQHLLVDEAVNMAVGGMDIDDIVKNLEVLRDRIGLVFSVESLVPLNRGGRYTGSKANTTLNTRPIFGVKSRVRFLSNTRGLTARINGLLAAVPDTARRIFVVKVGDGTDVTPLVEKLKMRFPAVKIHLRTAGPVVSVHVGVGAFGVAYIE